jgi:hypothetical protein
MLWVAAFLSLIIWVLGMASDFLGLRVHLFLLFALLFGLAAILPSQGSGATADDEDQQPPIADAHARSVPADEALGSVEGREGVVKK